LKTSAQVVVIGGGIVGCSILYHLAKNGWPDVVLLERRELTSGSSWHAAGGLFTITRPDTAAVMHRYTFQSYRELEALGETSCGFHFTGGMSICRTQDEMDSNAMMQSACRRLGIESHFMSPSEAKQRAPLLNTECFIGALWEDEGGHVDPASATQAFAAAARRLGAEIYRQTPVRKTTQCADGGWVVGTDNGEIKAEYIVNAAGLWGREVAALAGIELPLMPVEHHYLVTEDLPIIEGLAHELPQINDNEIGVYARQEGQGLLLGAYEKNCTHWSKDGTPADFGHELLPDDLSRMEWNFSKSIELMPVLGEAGVKRIINGPMIFSPDLGPLIGPHPLRRNYFCANGVMAGFNQGAGIGRTLAEWLIQGEPEIDVFCWDVARFGDFADKSYTEQTTRYFYENRSEKIFPYQEFETGRPIYKPAVYDCLKQANAVFGVSFGHEHPNWFAPHGMKAKDSLTYRQPNWWKPVINEGKRIRNEVGLMEFSAMAKFEVQGPGAEDWLDRLMTNNLPECGRIRLSPMLSKSGRLVGDFSISKVGPERFFLLSANVMQLIHMRRFWESLPREGVKLTNLSSKFGGLHICGPKAQELMCRITEQDMDSDHFPFLSVTESRLGTVDNVLVLRISFTGETGYELYLPMEQQLQLYELLYKEGQNLGLGLVGTRSLMQTRLEKSFPAWGLELSSDYTPMESNLSAFVKPNKGEFIGRMAVLKNPLPRERLATFTVDAKDNALWGGEAIFLNGNPIGYVSSGGYGPEIDKHIALGYVESEAYETGKNYDIEMLGRLYKAELHSEPLYDPGGRRMRN